jgi:hypothetical protein
MRHGYGVYTWRDGDRYEGYWENNKRDGEGMFTNFIKIKANIFGKMGTSLRDSGVKIVATVMVKSYGKMETFTRVNG